MIFYCVVSAAFNVSGNYCPRISLTSVENEEDPLLFFAPLILFNRWIQMIVPSFATLFADPALERVRDLCPFLRPFLLDQ